MATLAIISNTTAAGETDIEGALVAAAGGGDEFLNDRNTIFVLKNGSGGPITATFASQTDTAEKSGFDTLTHANRTLVVADGDIGFAMPFPGAFEDASRKVQVTYSGVSSVTVGAFKLNSPSDR